MFKKSIVTLIMMIITWVLLAQDKNSGKSGYQFLKLPVVPELAGTGNTGEVNFSSPLLFLQNPVAFHWQRGAGVAFSNTQWFADTSMYNLAWRNILFNQSLGFGMTYFDYGKLEQRTDNGLLIGEYNPMDLRITSNYTRKITPSFNAGLNLNVAYQKIDTSSSLALFLDFGVLYLSPLRGANIDLTFKNIGTSTKMDQEKTPLPFTAEMGISLGNYNFLEGVVQILPATKIAYMNDHDDLLPSLGVNFQLYEVLFLRVGYKFNYNEESFSAGMGVEYASLRVDYSFVAIDIEDIHLFGIGWRF